MTFLVPGLIVFTGLSILETLRERDILKEGYGEEQCEYGASRPRRVNRPLAGKPGEGK
jgi:hypothetical protein